MYVKPALERFGTFRELTQQGPYCPPADGGGLKSSPSVPAPGQNGSATDCTNDDARS